MGYYVYILISREEGDIYVGQTADVSSRLAFHNAGQVKSTSYGVPWVLLWSAEKVTRSEAVRLERKLKNLSRKRLVSFCKKYGEGVSSPDELLRLQKLSGC